MANRNGDGDGALDYDSSFDEYDSSAVPNAANVWGEKGDDQADPRHTKDKSIPDRMPMMFSDFKIFLV